MWLYRIKLFTTNKYLHYIAIFCLVDGKAFAWKSVTDLALLNSRIGKAIPKGDNKWEKGKLIICIGASEDMSELMRMIRAIASMS